ncbi:CvpA family protein [Vagococcus zengguangii]|uniref:CvpA family protein n=1 Tax=Vagococcus zengguangii TaxID=2571750 RepID=A0A4D7CXW8_9ENTE|nr:CvpA family protein [Vagococcus zengguangii]QCI86780.1 CvpA family protein [Vagococcus zengguangii]TLG80386.1 CvpA family protein [Vagococcus zengguangii]
MLSLLLIVILGFAAFRGVRRGFVFQTVHTIGYLIVFYLASKNFEKLSDKLELLVPYPQPALDSNLIYYSGQQLFDLDQYYYAGVAFLLILLIGWAVIRFTGFFFYGLTFFDLFGVVGKILSGILAVMVAMVTLSCILNVVAMVPLDFVQNMIEGSGLAKFIIANLPYYSNKIIELWTQTAVS